MAYLVPYHHADAAEVFLAAGVLVVEHAAEYAVENGDGVVLGIVVGVDLVYRCVPIIGVNLRVDVGNIILAGKLCDGNDGIKIRSAVCRARNFQRGIIIQLVGIRGAHGYAVQLLYRARAHLLRQPILLAEHDAVLGNDLVYYLGHIRARLFGAEFFNIQIVH